MSAINTQSHVARVDALKDLSKMTLDVIGLAGMAAVTIFVVLG